MNVFVDGDCDIQISESEFERTLMQRQLLGDLRKEPARSRSLLRALDLGLVLYKCRRRLRYKGPIKGNLKKGY